MGRVVRRFCSLWVCRKFCLFIRCFRCKELFREKVSGVREVSSFREEEGGFTLGILGVGCFFLGWGVLGRGEERGGGEEDGSWVDFGRLVGSGFGGFIGFGRLVVGEFKFLGGRMLSFVIVVWIELMGTFFSRIRFWEF